MIDLHTHTLLSDGELVPAEHIRRAQSEGYRVLGFADHVDLATMEAVIPVLLEAARRENELGQMTVLAGVELTHVRPTHIAEATRRARRLGAQYVICHGETLVEPVMPGTNAAAIEAGVDILAHPGLIEPSLVKQAAESGVRLEISGKAGHSLANGHVAKLATACGATLLFGSDAHGPGQFAPEAHARNVCRAAGLEEGQVEAMFASAQAFADELAGR
ncbi:MAG: histidinol phosphate phosphatase domain-containing protein [Phycisphaerae bacterium]